MCAQWFSPYVLQWIRVCNRRHRGPRMSGPEPEFQRGGRFRDNFAGHGTLVASMIIGYDTTPNMYFPPSVDGCVRILPEPWALASNPSFPAGHLEMVVPDRVNHEPLLSHIRRDVDLIDVLAPAEYMHQFDPRLHRDPTNHYHCAISDSVVVPAPVCLVHRDQPTDCAASGTFQLGLGVSPFGRIGSTRVFTQNANIVNGAPNYLVSGFCLSPAAQGLVDVLGAVYGDGARIQNDSWSDLLERHGKQRRRLQ